MSDYNKAIADTAKELMIAWFASQWEHYEFLLSKLAWMIDAEKFGWDPNKFKSSCVY